MTLCAHFKVMFRKKTQEVEDTAQVHCSITHSEPTQGPESTYVSINEEIKVKEILFNHNTKSRHWMDPQDMPSTISNPSMADLAQLNKYRIQKLNPQKLRVKWLQIEDSEGWQWRMLVNALFRQSKFWRSLCVCMF